MFKIEKYTVKNNPRTIAQEMIDAQGDVRFMASGSFGAVYSAAKSAVVYKIGDIEENYAYLSYLKVLAKQTIHNPFTPKIYGLRYITDKTGDGVFVVAMERLKELPDDYCEIPDYFEEHVVFDSRNSDYSRTEKVLGIQTVVPPTLKKAFKLLKAAFKEGNKSRPGCSWDLHTGNFMMRGKQIVCIDPLS